MAQNEDRKYTVIKTSNGFIVELNHKEKYYNDINKFVATTLKDVAEIISKDLLVEDKKDK